MVDFKEITINEKDLFNSYLKENNLQISEMTFTNFFMWRDFYKFRYAIINDFLCIVSVRKNEKTFALCPLGKENAEKFSDTIKTLKQYFNEKNLRLIFQRIEEKQLIYFLNCEELKFDYVADRDNSDYVYLAEDLITLKGKKFHAKRNHINKFNKLYSFEYVELTNEHIEECIKINNSWCEDTDCNCVNGEFCERYANFELLRNMEKLNCHGALIKVNGVFQAYTVGEVLNENTVVIHIEKANRNIDGLYTLVNQQFCERTWGDIKYINREQDLGIEGLRKAKLSYHPVKIIDKYEIFEI